MLLQFETLGVICEEAKVWIHEIGKQLIDKADDKKARCYLMQIISMEMQRPSNKELDLVFYLLTTFLLSNKHIIFYLDTHNASNLGTWKK